MSNEIKINVPLDPKTKAALDARADANDRQTGREAAAIIKRTLARDAAKSAKSEK